MSISARARTLTNAELIDLYEVSNEQERHQLAHELYTRLFRYVVGRTEHAAPQQQILFTNK
jgi:hypothetical protein